MAGRPMQVLTVLCRGGWMPGHLSEGWRRLGAEVHEFLYGTHMGRDWSAGGGAERARIQSGLLALARRLKAEDRLDLVFAVIYDDMLDEDTARALRALDVPMVNYHVDLEGQWYRVLRTGRHFDRLACAQEVHWAALRRAGIRPWLMPMAANPPREPAGTVDELAHDGVLYLGSPWLYRRVVLAELAAAGVPLRVRGHGWQSTPASAPAAAGGAKLRHDLRHYLWPRLREEGAGELAAVLRERRAARTVLRSRQISLAPGVLGGPYAQESFASLVRGAAVNLGFTHFSGEPGTRRERRQMRLRDFEIPMHGGFYLAQRAPELAAHFREGEHVAAWDRVDDLIDQARHYLARPAERARMAAQAALHARAFHTWDVRFRGLLAELGVTIPGARA